MPWIAKRRPHKCPSNALLQSQTVPESACKTCASLHQRKNQQQPPMAGGLDLANIPSDARFSFLLTRTTLLNFSKIRISLLPRPSQFSSRTILGCCALAAHPTVHALLYSPCRIPLSCCFGYPYILPARQVCGVRGQSTGRKKSLNCVWKCCKVGQELGGIYVVPGAVHLPANP